MQIDCAELHTGKKTFELSEPFMDYAVSYYNDFKCVQTDIIVLIRYFVLSYGMRDLRLTRWGVYCTFPIHKCAHLQAKKMIYSVRS